MMSLVHWFKDSASTVCTHVLMLDAEKLYKLNFHINTEKTSAVEATSRNINATSPIIFKIYNIVIKIREFRKLRLDKPQFLL